MDQQSAIGFGHGPAVVMPRQIYLLLVCQREHGPIELRLLRSWEGRPHARQTDWYTMGYLHASDRCQQAIGIHRTCACACAKVDA